MIVCLPIVIFWYGQCYRQIKHSNINNTTGIKSFKYVEGYVYKDSYTTESGTLHYIRLKFGCCNNGTEGTLSGEVIICVTGNNELMYWGQNVRVEGPVEISEKHFIKAGNIIHLGWESSLFQKRKAVNQYFQSVIDRRDKSGLLSALLLGKVQGIAVMYKQQVRDCGASHLLALSGFHLGIFIQIAAVAAGRKKRRKYIKAVILALAWMYHIIAGPIASLTRAVMTMTLLILFEGGLNPWKIRRALVLATVTILIINPVIVKDIAFRLSFFSLYGILTLSPLLAMYFRIIMPKYIGLCISSSIASQLATLGITATVFNAIPIFGFVYILILTPLVTLYAFTGLFTILVPQFVPFLTIIRRIISFILDLHSLNNFFSPEGAALKIITIATGTLLLLVFYSIMKGNYGSRL